MSSSLKLKYAASILNGYAYDSKAYVDDGKPLIRIGDVKKDIDLSGTRKIPVDIALSTMRFKLQKNDSLIALTGATIGKSFQYKLNDEAYLNQRVASVRARKGYDQSFIQYALSTDQLRIRQNRNIDSTFAPQTIMPRYFKTFNGDNYSMLK